MTTSKIDTFIQNVENGNINTVREKVYDLLRKNKRLSIFQISEILGIKIQTISGRISELRDMGLVSYISIKEKNSTVSYYFAIEAPVMQQDIRDMVRKERFNDWLKRGLKFKDELNEIGIDIDKILKIKL